MLTLAAWLHDIDPFALRISGNFGIRWYGVSYLLGFLIAFLLFRWLAKRRLVALTPHQTADFIMAIVVGVIVGGRLGSVFLYNIDLLWTFTASPPWWGVLAINKGGMASHGGMIGCILACIWFGRRHGIPFSALSDMIVFAAPFGLFFGRVANFINGELLGKVVPPGESLPWAVKFPQEMELYWSVDRLSALEPLAARFSIDPASWQYAMLAPNAPENQALIYALTERLIQAIQKGDQAVIAVVEPLLSSRHPSQLYQAIAEGLVIGIVLWIIWAKPRTMGIVVGWFFILYAILRLITEHWRLPDAHLEVQRVMGLSRGQLFSLPLFLIGGLYIWYGLARLKIEHGGWLLAFRKLDAEAQPAAPAEGDH